MDQWEPPRSNELYYTSLLKKLLKPLTEAVKNEPDPKKQIKIIWEFTNKRSFKNNMEKVIREMYTRVNKTSETTWRRAIRVDQTPQRIYSLIQNELRSNSTVSKLFKEILEKNSSQIRKVSPEVSNSIANYVSEQSLKGNRPSDIAKGVNTLVPNLVENRIKTIAQTQTSMCSTALTEARALSIGRPWYIWKTAEDRRVRTSHDVMDNVICNFNDPPSPEKLANKMGKKRGKKPWPDYGNYNPGNIFNCRCYPEVLINLDTQVKWPAKVYHNGKITRMTKEQFRRLFE